MSTVIEDTVCLVRSGLDLGHDYSTLTESVRVWMDVGHDSACSLLDLALSALKRDGHRSATAMADQRAALAAAASGDESS